MTDHTTNNNTSELARQNFDQHWLKERPVDAAQTDIVCSMFLDTQDARDAVLPHLAQAILDHHFHRRRIAALVRQLGHAAAAEYFADNLPKNNNTRKGNFGEVVASEHLIQRYGYDMPVFKLRFRDSHELAMRGEDIIAFEMEAEAISRVIIGEAKCIVQYRKATVRSAHSRLADAVRPRPMTLSLLSEILYTEGRDDLASEIDRVSLLFLDGEFPRQNWIVLINQDQPEDPFSFLKDEDVELVTDLHCVGVSLSKLSELVDFVYGVPGVDQEADHAP